VNTIGLDVGGTTVKGGLVDSSGRVLASASHTTDTTNIDHLTDTLAALVEQLSDNGRVHAVGIGLPGPRSSESGEILVSPNIPCLTGVQPDKALRRKVDLPIVARNDADMSAWGEFSVGAGAGTRYMVCLTLGTGVGSGIVLDGHLYGGARGYASEAGHMTVDPDGMPCSCGSRGCLEAVASATGIVALARAWLGPGEREGIPEPWSAEALCRAAAGGHAGAGRVFDQAGRYLGIACATLINLLNPEMIVIAGGVMAAGDLILAPALKEARLRAFDASFAACAMVPSKLGTEAGIIGAALFARHVTT
jgi:glucokinase